MGRVLDTSALDREPGDVEVREYRDRHRASGAPVTDIGRRTPGLVTLVGWTLFALAASFVVGTVVAGVLDAPRVLLIAPCWVVAVGVGVRTWRRRVEAERPWSTWARCDAFARANGMSFAPCTSYVAGTAFPQGAPEPGTIFARGSGRARLMGFERPASPGCPRAAVGLYTATSGDGSFSDTRTVPPRWWTYVALGDVLPDLPQVVLDARGNDRRFLGVQVVDLPGDRGRQELVALGGGAERWFRVYAPEGTHDAVRAALTPDLVAALVDPLGRGPGVVDAELLDGTLLLSWEGETSLDRASVWRTLEAFEGRVRAALAGGPGVVQGAARETAPAASAPGARLQGTKAWPLPVRVGVIVAMVLLLAYVLPHLPGG